MGKSMARNSTQDPMTVGFFLPTFNNLEELKKAINSILPHSVPFVVGVDGSTDGTVEWLQQNHYSFLHHPNFENRGRAATRNLALSLNWDWIIFMDSDLEFTGKLHTFFQNPSHINIYVGYVTYHNKKNNPWLEYCSTRGVHKSIVGPISFESFATGICAVPKPLFHHLKGFDEQFTSYGGEDLEFAMRAKNHHAPFFKSADLSAISWENKSVENALEQLKIFGETGLRIIQKKHPLFDPYRLKSGIPIFFSFLALKIYNNMPPGGIRRKLIHYLVYCSVKEGFYSKRI
jgi:glycosyltransferase involved in cell wall biosynthesis